ncbi:unnamed protein product [Prorocentrum cordatum]|uniref:Secreted protein n=1 Tax=Prorocentrum cordatum TaxID=2364126 RepID=A0ABN9SXB0_9DINO|nr:unnamed protein product [Polarella glacialis]
MFKVFLLSLAVRPYFADAQSSLVFGALRAAVRVRMALPAPEGSTTVRWSVSRSAVMRLSAWERCEQLRMNGQRAMAVLIQHVITRLVLCAPVCSAAVIQNFARRTSSRLPEGPGRFVQLRGCSVFSATPICTSAHDVHRPFPTSGEFAGRGGWEKRHEE